MAEDDFKECAEAGKHIAMGLDVLDRIEQHYAQIARLYDVESLPSSEYFVTEATIKYVPVDPNAVWMDPRDCCPQEMVNVVLSYDDLWNLYLRSDAGAEEDIMLAIRDVARGG